ncbi:MAG: orotidine-5'-phosphate decarboxylase [Acidimicrobiales bacterium]|jgi:orotidine-5'-phosphate decarboxylase|nr:orotidine-5'-phosphate decarboxylase [Acidimicrobiales bacterium]
MSDEPTTPQAAGAADPASGAPAELRSKLALVLDLDDLVEALRLAHELRPWFGVAKVGLELYSAAGPDAVLSLSDAGFDVFVDLKMFDIPTTVHRAARVVGSLGARYLTLHARDDGPMLRAGVEGFLEGAEAAGFPEPCALGVTVLTSDDSAPPHILPRRVALAAETGCGGIVCAASDLREARQLAPRLRRVVPGIRPAGSATHDQARPATPREALDAGADVLVIGRAVTQAPDRAAAAAALVAELT